MAVDIENDLKDVSKQIGTYQQYKEFKESYDGLKKVAGDSFEKNQKYVSQVLDKFKQQKNKQDNNCTPFLEHLLQQLKKIRGSGLDTDKFVKKLYLDSLKDSKKGFAELLVSLAKEFLNCGSNQQYPINSTFYIPVDQVDLFGVLQTAPTDKVGKFFYEEKPANFQEFIQDPVKNPFSMNRELYNLTQNLNQPFSALNSDNYLGSSLQNLFDITYVETYVDPITNQPQNGSFFKVDLKPRQTFPSIDEFLNDYYSTINVLEFKTFFTYLIDFSTGCISFEQGSGKKKLEVVQKVLAFNRRVSCLCSDATKEISVGGTAKISEIDNTTDSFFELSDIDVRIIEQNISNIKRGVVEFEDCDNLQIIMNSQAAIEALDTLQFNQDTSDPNEYENALNVIYPVTDQSFKPSLDDSFIKQFLNAMMATILSPKAILPFMLMVYATNQPKPKYSFDIEKFATNFRTYYIKFVSALVAKFTEKVFKILKKQILKLVSFITKDINQEKREKIEKMILSIVSLLTAPFNFVTDFRECKSCIDELLKILNVAVNASVARAKKKQIGGEVPLPLLLASKALAGYSSTRAFMNVVNDLEAIGVPVGPMPDGSPNKFVASVYSIIKGQEEEMAKNGKVAIGIGPLTSTPTGITLPADAYGKFI